MSLHVVVSWDISAQGETHKSITDKLLAVMKPYAWVRPLNTFYVVQVADVFARQRLNDALLAVAQSQGTSVLFVVSPPMQGGQYTGFLPSNLWPEINKVAS